MPEQPEQPKSPVLRLSQKKLTDMVETGEVQIVHTKEQLLVTSETKAWETFLGKKLEEPIPSPPKELFEVLNHAKEKGITIFEPHYLPNITFHKDDPYPGWEVRPDKFIWDQVKEGDLSDESVILDGFWILLDSTQKPNYKGGKQMYEHDPFAQMLAQLRKEGKIKVFKGIPNGSRFDISYEELDEAVLPNIANLLGVSTLQVSLPKTIEFNILGNLFHPEWGRTTTWEFFEDKFKGNPFVGGSSNYGGLLHTNFYTSDHQVGDLGFRPMIVFPFDAAQGKPLDVARGGPASPVGSSSK